MEEEKILIYDPDSSSCFSSSTQEVKECIDRLSAELNEWLQQKLEDEGWVSARDVTMKFWELVGKK